MKIENSVKPKKIGIINKLGTSKSIKLIARTVYTKKPTERDFPSVELSQGIPEKPIIKEKKLKLKSISKFIVNRNLVAFMNDRKFSYQPKNSDTRDLLLYANLNSLIEKSKS
ncbi:hypothetical protein A3Q56_06350 [Intoshia linei]|uniref:Uncharacterized protein n=1 Tax=Intoshia linei TaxID=1819745 RepID=A0A177AX29_9BILA|nr:hypothetical protein A3Q56_06350 [Intoshia linei]